MSDKALETAGRRRFVHPAAFRLALAQIALFMMGGAYLPFFPLWLAAQGFGPELIGILYGAANLLRVFTSPVAGIVADARNSSRGVAMALAAIALMFWAGMALSSGIAAIFAFAVLAAIAHAGIGPLVEAATVRNAHAGGFDYGRVRLCGSIAFVAVNVIAGALVNEFGPDAVVVWMVGVGALTVGAASLMPRGRPEFSAHNSFREGLRATWRDARIVARNRVFAVFLLAASLVQASHAFHYGFFTLTLEEWGYRGEIIGAMFALGAAAEVALFYFARHAFERFGAINLMLIGAGAAVLRWAVTAFAPPLETLLAAQLLHAASFGAAHLGAMMFILHAAPARIAATSQSLYSIMCFGVMMAPATYLSGELFEAVRGFGFLAMAAMAAGSFALVLVLARLWDGKEIALQPQSSGAGGKTVMPV